ncbi:MAG: ABC transporter permease [Coriobacteriia bacterium]|nr:ABC transporter permease [Coriobacteriia bacterium]
MRTFGVLLRKELRELVTFQMLGPFVAIVVIFIALGGVIGSAGDGDGSTRLVVIDNDLSVASQTVIASLESVGLDVTVAEDAETQTVIDEHSADGVGLFVTVPEGFATSLESEEPLAVEAHAVMTDFSFLGMQGTAEMQAGLATANQALATAFATRFAPDAPLELLQTPLRVEHRVTVGEETAATSPDVVGAFIAQQTTFIPIVLFIVIIFAAQLIATTIATEKENKTLETLLSYPVSRTSLVTAKMVAAGLVSLVAAAAYMLGMQQYMAGLETSLGGGGADAAMQASRAAMTQLGLVLGPADYVMLGLSLFAGILLALSIAIILGAFAESVKAAAALLTPLMVLLMVPYMLTMFVNLNTASPLLKWGLLAIPFTHAFTAAQNLFLGNDIAVWLGIGYQLLWFVGFALIAARIFSSDRILTMKLDIRRKK